MSMAVCPVLNISGADLGLPGGLQHRPGFLHCAALSHHGIVPHPLAMKVGHEYSGLSGVKRQRSRGHGGFSLGYIIDAAIEQALTHPAKLAGVLRTANQLALYSPPPNWR